MIVLDNVSLNVRDGWKARPVILNVTLAIPANRRIALLGGLPEQRNAVLNLISGTLLPTKGRIVRKSRTSFPTTLTRAFDATISLRSNLHFVASVYDVNSDELIEFVTSVLDFGSDFDKPYQNLPQDIRRQLVQIVALCLPFDIYIINGIFSGGPKPLRDAALALFDIRSQNSGIILNSRNMRLATKHCEMALVIEGNSLILCNSTADAATYIDIG
jgi:capsular polysaccharide transport system ATP-binding protein